METVHEMLMAAYYMRGESYGICDRESCINEAAVRVDVLDGRISELLCVKHAAQHMRGNAYALAGADDDPEPIEAQIMNELDGLAPLDVEEP